VVVVVFYAMLLRMNCQAVIFDGDDTLWFVEQLFDEARDQAAAIVAATGLDALAWDQLERKIDVENVGIMGLSPQRFPTSCVRAYRQLAAELECLPDKQIEARIWDAAYDAFLKMALPAHRVTEILRELSGTFRLALLTKGDEVIQRKRIGDASLADAFDCLAIVPDKGEKEFRDVLAAVGCKPEAAWSVGNSLASDINPALRMGMRAIWIDAHVWEYERRELSPAPGYLVTAQDLRAAADFLLSAASEK
jgi:putative hydrolase of the HAD superfamily